MWSNYTTAGNTADVTLSRGIGTIYLKLFSISFTETLITIKTVAISLHLSSHFIVFVHVGVY